MCRRSFPTLDMLKLLRAIAEDDSAVKSLFDHVRNLGIAAAVLGAAVWKFRNAEPQLFYFEMLIVALLAVFGMFLFFVNQFHGIRKLPGGGMDVLEHAGKSNLSDVSAVIGTAQLAKLERFNARRAALARRYLDKLGGLSGLRLPAAGHAGHAWHLFAPLVAFDALNTTRERFIQAMHVRGVGVGVHYQALHLFEAFRRLGYRAGDFPNAETIGARTLTLPLHTQLQDEDVDRVCRAVKDSMGQPQ